MVNNFNEYLLDLLIESVLNKETYLLFSPSFNRLINKIDHPISYQLLNDQDYNMTFKISFIDIDYSGNDKVSFITVPKAAEILSKLYNNIENVPDYIFRSHNYPESEIYSKNRVITTIGRLINKLYPNMFPISGKPGEDIESFTTLFKSYQTTNTKFELVNGSSINYWYNGKNYSKDANEDTTLGNSCMQYEECQEYIDFYSKNPESVSLLILKDTNDDSKIIGRSLVWKLNEPDGRIFMDRIYVMEYSHIQLFINYAIDKGWLYKKSQSYQDDRIIDPKGEIKENNTLMVKLKNRSVSFPFMDTLMNYNSDINILSSNEKYFSKYKLDNGEPLNYNDLQNDGGGPDTIYSEYYDDYFIIDDLVYCEFGDDNRRYNDCKYLPYYYQFSTLEYFEKNIVTCKYYNSRYFDKFLEKEDAIFLDVYNEYMSPVYKWNKLFVQNDEHIFIKKKDAVYSESENRFLYIKDAIKVFNKIYSNGYDWVLNTNLVKNI